MMLNDLFLILYWWFLLFGLGVFFLPFTLRIFKNFFDQGYALSKIIAILLLSYLIYLLGSLKILPFTQKTIWGIVICLGIINLIIFKIKNLKFKIKIFLFEELLFLVCLIFWSYIRGFQPNIHGLEKFMDFGFVNSLLRSQYFPPKDMWLSGKTINYYYFGHLVVAVLTKLSGLDSVITYNLMIATIFALCFTAAFSLGGNLFYLTGRNSKKFILLAGLISALLLTLGGNLQPLWYFFEKGTFSGYWYPDATRFIIQKFGASDNTIHEFPIYSFVVSDLHGHLLDLPFVLLFLGLTLTIFTQKQVSLFLCFLTSLLLGVFYMTNAWDLPIYLLVLGSVFFATTKSITKTMLSTILYSLFSILYSLPFHFNFQSIAKGIGLVDFHSPAWMLFFLWGFPLLMTISFLVFLSKKKKVKVDYFVLILLAVSWLLILIPEIFYVKDIYIHSYQRANTMFKLTYQSFVMFSLVSGYIIVRILTNIKKKLIKNLFTIYYLLFTICLLFYSYFAIRSYYGLERYQGLDGLKYLQTLYPDDYQAILWLRKEIADQLTVLEAVGESYTDFARVSANTGLPTVVGWPVHEWLWRGSYDEVGQRREEVRKIYESERMGETKDLLRKYDVNYVFIGALERKQYESLSEKKFNSLGRVVFQQGQTKIYQIK